MSPFKSTADLANAAYLRQGGAGFSYANSRADDPVDFTGVRHARLPDAAVTSTKESVWSRLTEFDPPLAVGAAVWLSGIEYVLYDLRPDPDPDSDGVTLCLDRREAA